MFLKGRDARQILIAFGSSLIGLIAYPVLRVWVGQTPIVSLLIAVLLALAAAVAGKLQEQGSSPLGSGERRVGGPVVIPYDRVSIQLALGQLLVVLSGVV